MQVTMIYLLHTHFAIHSVHSAFYSSLYITMCTGNSECEHDRTISDTAPISLITLLSDVSCNPSPYAH